MEVKAKRGRVILKASAEEMSGVLSHLVATSEHNVPPWLEKAEEAIVAARRYREDGVDVPPTAVEIKAQRHQAAEAAEILGVIRSLQLGLESALEMLDIYGHLSDCSYGTNGVCGCEFNEIVPLLRELARK